jgi:hypothetical protein
MKRVFIMGLAVLVLASCAEFGFGRSPALEQLFSKAEGGHAESQYQVALRYTNGRGVGQNYAQAAGWLKLAGAQGHGNAQYLLGIAYASGRGIEQNQEAAVSWFTKAADGGHARAQYQLAEAFANARGAIKDLLWALRWYEKAARNKHTEAGFSLGVLWASGSETRVDLEQAWVWLQLAAGGGHELAARVGDRVETRLSPSALSDARTLLDNWTWPAADPYDDSPTVRYIQRSLARLGFPAGRDDGVAGPATNAAIEAFLEARGTVSTGAINRELVTRIKSALSGQ